MQRKVPPQTTSPMLRAQLEKYTLLRDKTTVRTTSPDLAAREEAREIAYRHAAEAYHQVVGPLGARPVGSLTSGSSAPTKMPTVALSASRPATCERPSSAPVIHSGCEGLYRMGTATSAPNLKHLLGGSLVVSPTRAPPPTSVAQTDHRCAVAAARVAPEWPHTDQRSRRPRRIQLSVAGVWAAPRAPARAAWAEQPHARPSPHSHVPARAQTRAPCAAAAHQSSLPGWKPSASDASNASACEWRKAPVQHAVAQLRAPAHRVAPVLAGT